MKRPTGAKGCKMWRPLVELVAVFAFARQVPVRRGSTPKLLRGANLVQVKYFDRRCCPWNVPSSLGSESGPSGWLNSGSRTPGLWHYGPEACVEVTWVVKLNFVPRWLGRVPALFQLGLGDRLHGFRMPASGARSMPSGAGTGPMGPRSVCWGSRRGPARP